MKLKITRKNRNKLKYYFQLITAIITCINPIVILSLILVNNAISLGSSVAILLSLGMLNSVRFPRFYRGKNQITD